MAADFNTRVGIGSFSPAIQRFTLNGVNDAITTGYETIWDNSNAYTFLQTNMSSPTISGASANDTSAGTGARTVRVTGVDSTFTVQTEDVALSGQTGVALTKNYMSINYLEVLTAGSGLVNAGIIYVGTGAITTGVPAVVHGIMKAGLNVSTSAIYTVPANYRLVVEEVYCASRNTTAGGHQFAITESVNLGLVKFKLVDGFTNTSPMQRRYKTPLTFSEKTQLQAQVFASAGTGPAFCVINGFLIAGSPTASDTPYVFI